MIRDSVLIPVQIDGGNDNDAITLAGGSTAGSTLSGGGGDDYLSSTGGATVTLSGGDGNDFLLHGGFGTATLLGGNNNDHLVGGTATDVTAGIRDVGVPRCFACRDLREGARRDCGWWR